MPSGIYCRSCLTLTLLNSCVMISEETFFFSLKLCTGSSISLERWLLEMSWQWQTSAESFVRSNSDLHSRVLTEQSLRRIFRYFSESFLSLTQSCYFQKRFCCRSKAWQDGLKEYICCVSRCCFRCCLCDVHVLSSRRGCLVVSTSSWDIIWYMRIRMTLYCPGCSVSGYPTQKSICDVFRE